MYLLPDFNRPLPARPCPNEFVQAGLSELFIQAGGQAVFKEKGVEISVILDLFGFQNLYQHE